MQSGETNTIQNRINGLEKANANLMAYLEQGRATETILRSVEKNEQELQQLKQQLDALDNPISAVDDATYREIVQKFTNYMFHLYYSKCSAKINRFQSIPFIFVHKKLSLICAGSTKAGIQAFCANKKAAVRTNRTAAGEMAY